uniref:Two pore calcium channel protein 1-like n=1 Tax=Dermatophagoides pteronyssinus TaxID=6956 RepID=A0A6P6XR74_DERPT|nr:two pore calcium channel protein 1-like [Dermatophagoides pteronyssinus]
MMESHHSDSQHQQTLSVDSNVIDNGLANHLPICQSYTDMEESLRAQHRHSRFKHSLLHWFYRRFIQLPSDTSIDHYSIRTMTTTDSSSSSSSRNPSTDNKINRKMLWSLNYLEASIYLEEGLNNDKFDHHPHLFTKLPMYLIAHNRFVYALDLFCCWLILSLALTEKPAVDHYHLPEAIHATLELIALSILAIILFVKLQWIGMAKFFKHGRTLIKTIVLLLMIIEAIVVLLRQDSHFRVTRSLRPVFLIDNFHFFGVRRVIRQTFQSLRSFIDMLALLLFFLIFFSISAFYLFSGIPNYTQFSTIIQSFLSLFVLLTTANFPDVMMPAYQKSQLYALFFIIFLVINLYFLLNIMLAVVYNSFSQIEKDKFRKLFLHRRKACDHAFRLLVTNNNSNNIGYIEFEHFSGLMNHLKPHTNQLERFIMYKALIMEVFTPQEDLKTRHLLHRHDKKSTNSKQPSGYYSSMNAEEYLNHIINAQYSQNDNINLDNDNHLTLEKFYHIYEILNLKWENLDKSSPWFDRSSSSCCLYLRWFPKIMYRLRSLVMHRYFDRLSYIIIIMAALYQFLDALIGWNADHVHKMFHFSTSTRTICAIFISLYTIEMLLKLATYGPYEYFRCRWNRFDFFITIIGLTTFIMNEYVHMTTITLSTSFFSFRSLKLLDLLRHHVHRYRDILGPFALIIIKRFMSVTMVVLIVYYFFAIIAMECFGQYSLIDCCQNSTLEPYYRSNGTTTSYYYLNNFQDLITSYITLFELMVVNNWQITMNAYVIVTGNRWSYIFFIAFYIITLVVITIVVSFVLDTFNFHIEYKHRFGPDDSMSVQISVEVPINQQEFDYYQSLDKYLIEQRSHLISINKSSTSSSSCCHRPSPRHFPCPIQLFCGWCSTMDNENFSRFDQLNESFKIQNSSTSSSSTPPPIIGINENIKEFETIVEEETDTQPVIRIGRPTTSTTNNKRTIMFRGHKIRDKFSYNLRMYHDELQKWINQSEFS